MPAKPKRWPPLLMLAAIGLNAVAALPALLAIAAPYLPPAPYWPTALAALMMPWLMLIPAAFMAVWWRRQWFLLGLNAILLAALSPAITRAVQISLPASPKSNELHLLTVNLKALDYNEANLDPLETFLQREKADVVVLQEFWTGNHRGSASALARLAKAGGYAHQRFVLLTSDNFGMAILSRFPLGPAERLTRPADGRTNGIMACYLHWQDHRIRLYNVHLQSYNLDATERALLDSVQSGQVQNKQMRGTLMRLRRAWRKQVAQVQAFERADTLWQGPSLVCGDLNNPAYGWAYARLKRHRQDSFVERGLGLGHTYGQGISSFRIDYVFSSPEFEVLSHTTVPVAVTDHRGVRVRLTWRTKSASSLEPD